MENLRVQPQDILYLKGRDKAMFLETQPVVSYEAMNERKSPLKSLIGERTDITFYHPISVNAWLTFEDQGTVLDDNQRSASDYHVKALFSNLILDELNITVKIQDRFTYGDTVYMITDVKQTDLIGNSGVFLRTEALCKRYKIVSDHPDKEPVKL